MSYIYNRNAHSVFNVISSARKLGCREELTLLVAPTETPGSVCSLVLCWSPVWAASQNTWGDPPLACDSSARSEPAHVCSAPVLPVFAGSSPGLGKYDRWQIILFTKCQKLCIHHYIHECYTENACLVFQSFLLLHQLLHLLNRLLEVKLQHWALLLNFHNPALSSHSCTSFFRHLLLNRCIRTINDK